MIDSYIIIRERMGKKRHEDHRLASLALLTYYPLDRVTLSIDL